MSEEIEKQIEQQMEELTQHRKEWLIESLVKSCIELVEENQKAKIGVETFSNWLNDEIEYRKELLEKSSELNERNWYKSQIAALEIVQRQLPFLNHLKQ